MHSCLRAGAALAAALATLPAAAVAQSADTLAVPGLEQPVEILKDRWGVSHIYAATEADLFFAQGWNAARDRLFQLEVWRRQATGTLAEVLGPEAVERDIGARLLRFRGDMQAEMRHYHDRGDEIIPAFVRGVNARIAQVRADPSLLPIEFRMLGWLPEPWTPEVVISRHGGLVSNLTQELSLGRAVAAIGAPAVKAHQRFHPGDPDIDLDPAIDSAALAGDILRYYSAYKSSVRFRAADLEAGAGAGAGEGGGSGGGGDGPSRSAMGTGMYETSRSTAVLSGNYETSRSTAVLPGNYETSRSTAVLPTLYGTSRSNSTRDADPPLSEIQLLARDLGIGSNNWVVSGDLTSSGRPFMANDPHRAQAAPSLRYLVHLVGPGWNVIGGGEPGIPGVSIGHNEHGAWGLTVFGLDSEDLYVYTTNPDNPNQYRYGGGWADMRVERDTIRVEGADDVIVDLKFTRHGPVLHEDTARDLAWALRAAWLDVGAAPYLASLRMDQATTWEEFREACSWSRLPGENMVWADTAGRIGWQAVGVAPLRAGWSGLVPVPGDGRYEWEGYLPIPDLPHLSDPAQGFYATANENQVDETYPHRRAIAWTWSDPFRGDRIDEVLASGRRFTLMDMMKLQHDELSIPARTLVPLLASIPIEDDALRAARDLLLDWDYVLDASSPEAGLYVRWERRLTDATREAVVPEAVDDALGSIPLSRIIEWLLVPDGRFGADPLVGRDAVLVAALRGAVAELRDEFGPDPSSWEYGRYKHALIRHPMSGALDDSLRTRFDVGPAPRGGYGNTVNATGGGDNQTSGASFRVIVDVGAWDGSVATNTPGQGGEPDDPHYRDLFPLWAEGRYFPLLYSRPRVEGVTDRTTLMRPGH